MLRRPHTSALFPYTTLFRSVLDDVLACTNGPGGVLGVPEDHQPGFVYQLRGPLVHQAGLMVFGRSEEHTSELQSLTNLVCRLLLEKKNPRPYRTKDS